jgi:hypothetical protein
MSIESKFDRLKKEIEQFEEWARNPFLEDQKEKEEWVNLLFRGGKNIVLNALGHLNAECIILHTRTVAETLAAQEPLWFAYKLLVKTERTSS